MKVQYVNDQQKGPGHGYFMLFGIPGSLDLSGARFTLLRASDQRSLGQSGWQPAEYAFSLPAENEDNSTIPLGPDIVDFLDAQENYRLVLKLANGQVFKSGFNVSDVVYSLKTEGAPLAAPVPPPPPPPPLDPPPPPEPVMPEEQTPEETEPAPPPPPPPPTPETDAGPKGVSRSLVLGLAGLLLLGCIGAALYVWGLSDKSPAPTPAPTLTALQQARQHLAGDANPETSLHMAEKLDAGQDSPSPDAQDAAFLLLEDAASKGNAQAMLLTGEFLDPTRPAKGSIPKNPKIALGYYKQALQGGRAEAGERLNALKTWAESEARNGSETARALLTEF